MQQGCQGLFSNILHAQPRSVRSRTALAQRWVQPRGPWAPPLPSAALLTVARAAPHEQQQPGGPSNDAAVSPKEALLAALRATGVPLEQIQIGRADGDDETWEDLLDAETDDPWMRSPQVSEIVEELLGGTLPTPEQQPQQQQQGKP